MSNDRLDIDALIADWSTSSSMNCPVKRLRQQHRKKPECQRAEARAFVADTSRNVHNVGKGTRDQLKVDGVVGLR